MNNPTPESLELAAEINDLLCDGGPALQVWVTKEGRYVDANHHLAALIDRRVILAMDTARTK